MAITNFITPYSPLVRGLSYALLSLIGATLLSWVAAEVPGLSLSVHFRFHYAWGLLLCLGGLWRQRKRLRWWLGVAALLFNLTQVLPLYLPPAPESRPAPDSPTLTLLSFNLLSENQHHAAARDYLLAQQPDVLLLLEFTPRWEGALAPVLAQYPHQQRLPRTGHYGMALLSRFPLDSTRWVWPGDAPFPALYAEVCAHGQSFRLMCLHPPAPPLWEKLNWRNQQLEALPALLGEATNPLILWGDFNLTEQHPLFPRLLAQLDLRDTRQGRGRQASWPVRWGAWGLPLDHCLIGPSFAVLDRTLGPNLGSDHRPLRVELSW